MDNNRYDRYDSHRPRKRVSRKTLRRRQLTALFIIALLVLLLILLIAHSCSGKPKNKENGKVGKATTTTTTMVVTNTDPAITTTAVTTTSADPVNKSDFKLDKYSVYIEVGETDTPMVQQYPDGASETDERWSTGDHTIATVDGYGHIKGVSPGTCYVTLRSAKDPEQEVMIKVTVRGDGTTSNDTASPQSNRAEAPEPPVYDTEGLTYVQGVLIANKSYSLPSTFEPGLEPLVYQQFQALSSAASKENLSIYINSGFRSYKDQEKIYDNYVNQDGADQADTYSARPGYSEHQTGLVIDVNDPSDAFAVTPEAEWLAAHAHEYGFIIRYPYGKESYTGYQYEPWHIRYVGSKLATKLYKSGQCLEEYLGIDSEYKD